VLGAIHLGHKSGAKKFCAHGTRARETSLLIVSKFESQVIKQECLKLGRFYERRLPACERRLVSLRHHSAVINLLILFSLKWKLCKVISAFLPCNALSKRECLNRERALWRERENDERLFVESDP